jgi:hypothetical protein
MSLSKSSSAAAAAQYRHVLVILEHDLVLLVEVEHGYGAEGGRDAAGLGHEARISRVHEVLDNRVIRRVEVVGQGEGTVAVTVKGVVAGRCHDPVVPSDVGKVHVERVPAAVLPAVLATVLTKCRASSSALHYVTGARHLFTPVVRVGVKGWSDSLPVLVLLVEAPSQSHVLLAMVRALRLGRVTYYLPTQANHRA